MPRIGPRDCQPNPARSAVRATNRDASEQQRTNKDSRAEKNQTQGERRLLSAEERQSREEGEGAQHGPADEGQCFPALSTPND